MLLQQSSFYTSQPQFPAPLHPSIRLTNSYVLLPSAIRPDATPLTVKPAQLGTQQGIVIRGDASSAALKVPVNISGYPYCFIGVAYFRDVTTNHVLTTLVNTAAESCRVQIDVNAGVLRHIAVGSSVQTGSVSVSANTWYAIACIGDSATSRRTYVCNLQTGVITSSSNTTSSTFPAAFNAFSALANLYNYSPDGNSWIDADIALAMWSGGSISDTQIRSILPNPWSIFYKAPSGLQVQATGATTHTTSGTLTGPGSTVSGTSVHKTLHTTSGAITGPGSTVAGVAVHPHKTTGVLTGPGSTVAGTSTRFRAHSTTGTLTGAGAVVAGSATLTPHTGTHNTSGVLTGQGSTVSGTSVHKTKHTTSGAIVGPGSSIVGSAKHPHITSGVLSGGSAIVVGTAHRGAITTHTTSGTLAGQGATVSSEASQQTLTHADLVAISNAVWNRLTDTTYTSGDLLRLIAAMAAGRVSGAQTGTEVFRDVGNTKNRITATVDDKGNRTSINLDPT